MNPIRERVRIRHLICVLSFISHLTANAAPLPATSSSALIGEKPGLFHSSYGFRLDSADTAWTQIKTSPKTSALVTAYRSPARTSKPPTLTVRVDRIKQNLTSRSYVRKYVQDYARFGFDVLANRAVRVGEAPAYRLDLSNREAKLQMEQVILVRDNVAVTLTCRDVDTSFTKSAKDCEKIIQTFRWTQE